MLNLLVKSFYRNALALQLLGATALEDPVLKVTDRVGSIVSLPLVHLHSEEMVGRLHDHVQSFFHTVGAPSPCSLLVTHSSHLDLWLWQDGSQVHKLPKRWFCFLHRYFCVA